MKNLAKNYKKIALLVFIVQITTLILQILTISRVPKHISADRAKDIVSEYVENYEKKLGKWIVTTRVKLADYREEGYLINATCMYREKIDKYKSDFFVSTVSYQGEILEIFSVEGLDNYFTDLSTNY